MKKSLLELAGTRVGSKEESDAIFREIFEERRKSQIREW